MFTTLILWLAIAAIVAGAGYLAGWAGAHVVTHGPPAGLFVMVGSAAVALIVLANVPDGATSSSAFNAVAGNAVTLLLVLLWPGGFALGWHTNQ